MSILATVLASSALSAAAGGAMSGAFGLVGDYFNRKEMRKQQAEHREMANKQFAWGQQTDRFQMQQTDRMNTHQITQDRVDRLNEMLRTNVELQNHARSMWGRR